MRGRVASPCCVAVLLLIVFGIAWLVFDSGHKCRFPLSTNSRMYSAVPILCEAEAAGHCLQFFTLQSWETNQVIIAFWCYVTMAPGSSESKVCSDHRRLQSALDPASARVPAGSCTWKFPLKRRKICGDASPDEKEASAFCGGRGQPPPNRGGLKSLSFASLLVWSPVFSGWSFCSTYQPAYYQMALLLQEATAV